MLHIHFANRFESLSEQLVARLGPGRGAVFAADVVIVPSAAVRRSLTLRLADAHGICAQVQFDFLANWLWQQLGRLLPQPEGSSHETSALAPRSLLWPIYSALQDDEFVAAHPRLAHYLSQADELMRWELAGSVAGLFEQYQSYRAEWLVQWLVQSQAGAAVPPLQGVSSEIGLADQRWQVALWRRVMANADAAKLHPAAALSAALSAAMSAAISAALAASSPGQNSAWRLPPQVPQQLHVFALPTMPPLHIQLLTTLGKVLDVHLYVLNPCQEHWFELIDRKRLAHLARSGKDQGFEQGMPLLAAWGRQTQSHVELLVDSCGADAQDDAHFEPHPGTTLLAQLHNAILELTDLAPGSVQLHEDDRSIELHVCHSLTRELEVLHNHLLGLFVQAEQGDAPPLAPSQVLVVLPDLVAAAPLIDAVFGTAPRQRRISYTVSGRPRSSVNAAARSLLALLALAASRCSASALFAVLQQPLVARRFGLDDVALQHIHDWLLASGFHWALDGPHRARFGVPADSHHTLDQALQRLFLAYASPDQIEHSLPSLADTDDALLPAGHVEGLKALPLGALWQFVMQLQALQHTLSQAHRPAAWAKHLQQVLQDFVLCEKDELADLRELREAINHLAQEQARGALHTSLPLAVVQAALQQSLDDPARGGVPTGQVTFSSMSSLRSLPFEVVCILGLNDGAFPSTPKPIEYDLMALAPRRGDRQRRVDERNLFLDLLLAARRSLYLSHSGRSVFDNAPLPPSVLVSELLDLLLPAIASSPDSAASLAQARQRLVLEHPLQPFDLQAFDEDADPRLRSFDSSLCEALQRSLRAQGPSLAAAPAIDDTDNSDDTDETPDDTGSDADSDDEAAPEPLPPFFTTALASPGPEWHSVSLEQLTAFFRNPCRTLLRQRLGISLLYAPPTLEDDEPFLPDWPARQKLHQRLLPALLAGATPEEAARLARAGPEQPSGLLGEQDLQTELLALQDFAAQVQAAQAEPTLPAHTSSLTFDIGGETWTLQGGFASLRASGQWLWQFNNTRAGDYLQSWLAHLLLCAAPAAGMVCQTQVLSRDGRFHYSPCGPAYAHLHELMVLYRLGLCRPLHFFPKSAWASVTSHNPLQAARSTWRTSKNRPFAEAADPAYRLAFRGQPEPLDAEFEALAQAVFGPLLQHLHDPRVRR